MRFHACVNEGTKMASGPCTSFKAASRVSCSTPWAMLEADCLLARPGSPTSAEASPKSANLQRIQHCKSQQPVSNPGMLPENE